MGYSDYTCVDRVFEIPQSDLGGPLTDIDRGGPTLWVIGCVVLNALSDFDPSARNTLRRYLGEIRREIPSLGAKRLAALERAATSPVPPMDLARAVLPFNFR